MSRSFHFSETVVFITIVHITVDLEFTTRSVSPAEGLDAQDAGQVETPRSQVSLDDNYTCLVLSVKRGKSRGIFAC